MSLPPIDGMVWGCMGCSENAWRDARALKLIIYRCGKVIIWRPVILTHGNFLAHAGIRSLWPRAIKGALLLPVH